MTNSLPFDPTDFENQRAELEELAEALTRHHQAYLEADRHFWSALRSLLELPTNIPEHDRPCYVLQKLMKHANNQELMRPHHLALTHNMERAHLALDLMHIMLEDRRRRH